MKLIATLSLLMILINAPAKGQVAACDSLIAPCVNTFSVNGYYFELKAISDNLLVKSFATLSQNGGERDIILYYKSGTYVGFEANEAAWTLVDTAFNFNPATDLSCPIPQTEVPIPVNVCLQIGEKYAFYLMKLNGTGTFEAHNELPSGAVAATDSLLNLYAGLGTQDFGPFQTNFVSDSVSFQGSIQYDCGCVPEANVEVSEGKDIKIYPVPATDIIHIDFNSATAGTVICQIYNAWGNVVNQRSHQKQSGQNLVTADISALPAGMYTVCLIEDDRTISGKSIFVKQ